jgi:hypothetical protein
MPRLVVPQDPAKGRFAAETVASTSPDDYRDRLVKYIPAESVAVYTLTDKMVTAYYGIDASGVATKVAADTVLTVASCSLFSLCLIGTPIYLYKQRLSDQPWGLHATLSTIAFVLWAYTLGGSVILIHQWYSALVAGLAAPIFTFVAGWFEPKRK